MRLPTKTQIRKINKTALAEKYDVSQSYVSEILHGIKSQNSEKAKGIIKDALQIIEVLEGEPTKTTKEEANV